MSLSKLLQQIGIRQLRLYLEEVRIYERIFRVKLDWHLIPAGPDRGVG